MEKKVLLKDLVDFGTHVRKQITSKVRVSDQGVYPIGEIWDANTVVDVIVNGAHDAHDTLRELDQFAHQIDTDLKAEVNRAKAAEQELDENKANKDDVYTKTEVDNIIGDLGMRYSERSMDFDYVHDEESWNDSYQNGGLKLYYQKYPSEDLWNPTEHRAANFNDKAYAAIIYADAEQTTVIKEAQFNAFWYSDTVQKITNREDSSEVYYIDMFYSVDDSIHELFTDSAMQTSANKYIKITEASFPDCIHCWEGAISNPGAKYPWVVPHFGEIRDSKIIFKYVGKDDVMPWGSKVFVSGSWGCASIPTEFNDDSFDIKGENAFDIDKFQMVLQYEVPVPYTVKTYIDDHMGGSGSSYVIGDNTVGTSQIIDSSILMEDLSDEVKQKL